MKRIYAQFYTISWFEGNTYIRILFFIGIKRNLIDVPPKRIKNSFSCFVVFKSDIALRIHNKQKKKKTTTTTR